MKMKKTLVALCLSAGMLACVPGMSLADVNFVPQNTSAAPAIPASALQQLIWTPADQSKTQSVDLTTGGQRLDVPGIVGPVAAWSVPANIGELTLTLDSELNKHKQIFCAERADSRPEHDARGVLPQQLLYLSAAGRDDR
ncbi:maltose regulon periplasmic protein [Klebsiella pneumoniae]|uniref:Maltose regulon periplasmic protein n=1 Tax=Klebsiella pneumoniae TaxID=573 RepID=A0A377XMR3_KLEPN|nr:maltose regulon periplasmic protein [Klebsiella pneumoniae]